MSKPSDGDIIYVCSHQHDMWAACAELGVSRGWLSNRLAIIENGGDWRRRTSCPLLVPVDTLE